MKAKERLTIGAEAKHVVDELSKRFRMKFGRDPRPGDPLFFDPGSDQPVPLHKEKLDRIWNLLADTWLRRGEITPAIAYAMKKTGLFVRDQDRHLLTTEKLARWNSALKEYSQAASEVSQQARSVTAPQRRR